LRNLLDQWLIIWQTRPHDGLRDPLHPGRAFSPNEKYAALTETVGFAAVVAQDPHLRVWGHSPAPGS
jgi:putative transposase